MWDWHRKAWSVRGWSCNPHETPLVRPFPFDLLLPSPAEVLLKPVPHQHGWMLCGAQMLFTAWHTHQGSELTRKVANREICI